MGVFAGTERQCTEDEHDDEDENEECGDKLNTSSSLRGDYAALLSAAFSLASSSLESDVFNTLGL
jgi:hypothetical protein